jgi:hypothetical protein
MCDKFFLGAYLKFYFFYGANLAQAKWKQQGHMKIKEGTISHLKFGNKKQNTSSHPFFQHTVAPSPGSMVSHPNKKTL